MEGHTGDVYTAHQGQYAPKPMPLEDGSFVYSFKYKRNNIIRNGAALKKIDKTTNECLACAQFESWPIYTDPDLMGYPIGLVKTVNDNLYFAYRTNNNISGGAAISKGWLGIAKLDKDLNIIWQRYCLGSYSAATGYFHKYCHVSQIEDGFAIVGYIQRGEDPWRLFYYFIHDGDPDGFPDTESFLRPYMFFPNPAQDQLTMQYSPDVQPRQIELYDLQGRLVCTQKQGLESLNLQGLVPGQYLMKVTMVNGVAYTDKVTKR